MLKKGDKVVMHTCMESESPENEGKIWTVASDEELYGKGKYAQKLVFLDGFSSKFDCEYLQKVDTTIYEKSLELMGKRNEYEVRKNFELNDLLERAVKELGENSELAMEIKKKIIRTM